MNRFNHYNLPYQESSVKKLTRIKLINAAFDLVVKNNIRNLTVDSVSKLAGIQKRSFYNYYENLDLLCEDVQILAMGHFYTFKYFSAKAGTTPKEAIGEILIKFVNHGFANKDLILYLDAFDTHYNYDYPSHRYDYFLDNLFAGAINGLINMEHASVIFKDFSKQRLMNATKLIMPTLYYSMAKYVRRENIYKKRYSFLTKESIYELVEVLTKYFE